MDARRQIPPLTDIPTRPQSGWLDRHLGAVINKAPSKQRALSDSHIHLPRNFELLDLSTTTPGEEPQPPPGFTRIRTIPSSLELMVLEETRPPSPALPGRVHRACTRAHRHALHFLTHLLLISLFETLFFWQFVSRQEDGALTGLVNTYTGRAFAPCATLSPIQRADLRTWFALFLNATAVTTAANTAAQERHAFNAALLRNSWLYFGALATTVGLLASTARLRGIQLHWRRLIGENLALVTLLGLYEWMFFRTVALQYQSVTPAELDGLVVTEFEGSC
jgi:hypothetical protein